MKFIPYPKYYQTRMKFIGIIPETWRVKKLKYLVRSKITDGPHETPEFINEGIPFLSVDSIQDGKLIFDNSRFISEKDHERFIKKCKPEHNDLLMGKAASIGKIARVKVDFEFSIWSPLALIKPNLSEIDSTYLEYVLKSKICQYQIYILSTMNTQFNISMDDIPNLILPIPPIEEQKQIAKFLEEETFKIENLIKKYKNYLNLLNEKRISLITQAVTKGIDSKAEMRNSGIEWIGKMPSHWKVALLKRICKNITDGSHFSPESVLEGVPYITVKDIQENSIDFENSKRICPEDFFLLKRNGCQPDKNDVLMSKDGTIGKCVVVKDDNNNFVVLSSIGIIKPSVELINSSFLRYYLVSGLNIDQMFSFIQGAALTRLTIDLIKQLIILIPSLGEQLQIVEYLDKETSKIDILIEKINRQIDLLEEYKISLISHAVTGKIDVRRLV